MRDPNLQHQVVHHRDGNVNTAIVVTCNCRERAGVGPMGVVLDFDDTLRVYNDPEQHVEPFGEEWRLNGQRRQGV